jgi:hypothetical protein
MANLDLAALYDYLAQNYRDRTVRTFNARSVLLKLLEKRKCDGKNHAWTWEGTGALAENFTSGQDVSNYGYDTKHNAILTPALSRSNGFIADDVASVAANSQLSGGFTRLVVREFENCVRKMSSYLNQQGYSGLGTGTLICGLDVALDDANTYAGVNRSTGSLAGFRSSIFDPGVLTAPTIAMLRSDISTVYDACGEVPNLAVCSTAVWNKIAALFTELRRFNQDVMNLGGRQIAMDASVSAIELDGTMFVKDKDATANTIYYLNTDYVRWEYIPLGPGMDDLQKQGRTMGLDDGYGAIPLGMWVKPLATTGAAEKFTMEVQANLVVEKPNACGKRLNVLDT